MQCLPARPTHLPAPWPAGGSGSFYAGLGAHVAATGPTPAAAPPEDGSAGGAAAEKLPFPVAGALGLDEMYAQVREGGGTTPAGG